MLKRGKLKTEAEKASIIKNFKINLKNASFIKKVAKVFYLKKLKIYSMANKNLSVTYHQTPLEVFSSLGLNRCAKETQVSKNLEKLHSLSKRC